MARMNLVNWPHFTGTCPRCGRPTNEGARFCRGCGQRLIENERVQSIANQQAQASKQAPTPTTPENTVPQTPRQPEQHTSSTLDWRVIAFVAGITAIIGLIVRSLIGMFT